MLWFLIVAAGFWVFGHVMRAPVSARLLMIGVLYLGALLAVALFPAGTGLRVALGGDLTSWLVLGGSVAVVLGYRRILQALRTRAPQLSNKSPVQTAPSSELERNARHIVLREIGGPGQQRLKAASVLVVGAGGLGSPVLQYLAAAGVGTIGVIDDDIVENSNLARQVIHKDAAIGTPKVFSAQTEMLAQNPNVNVRPCHRRLTEEIAPDLFAEYDLILDGTDNSETRYLVNKTCVALAKPLISSALSQWEGQISTFDPATSGPCYRCVFPTAAAPGLAPSCAQGGVLGPLPGVLGAMMAVEAVKEITGAGQGLRGRMIIYDALYGENRVMKLKRDANCPVCG